MRKYKINVFNKKNELIKVYLAKLNNKSDLKEYLYNLGYKTVAYSETKKALYSYMLDYKFKIEFIRDLNIEFDYINKLSNNIEIINNL